MRLELTEDDGVIIAGIEGEIDFAAADDLGRDILRRLPDTAAGLVLDLSGVNYVDSGGVRVIFELAGHLGKSGRRLGLAVPQTSPLHRLIKITRLEEAIVLCTSVAECTGMVRQA